MKQSDTPVRNLVALSVICLSASVGSWMIFVAPARGREATLQVQRDLLNTELTAQGTLGGDVGRWTTRLRQTAEATRQLRLVSAAAATERGVIERLGAMAEQSGIQIDEMRPQEIATADAASPSAPQFAAQTSAAGQTDKKLSDIRRVVRLVITGNYEALAMFFQTLDAPSQLAAVRSLRIVADGRPGASAVVAEASIELFCPIIPDAVSLPARPQQAQTAGREAAGIAVSGAEK